MNYIVNRIDLDVHDAGAQAWINVRQNETNRKICIALTESGEPFALTEDCDAVFAGTKPDATVFFNSCEIIGNTIEYVLTGQNLAQTGDLKCEIRLYGSGNTLICSPRFVVHVQENAVDDNGIESADEFSELTELIGDARAATDAANASVITGATASVDSNVGTPEVELTLTQEENGQSMDFEFHNLKGETGDPGVHVGDTAPTNPAISLWIDTDDNGASQVLSVMGTFASLAALQAAVTNPNNGDSYGVGAAAPYDIYRYDAASGEWINYGNYKGADAVVDATLTNEGEAADAKATGNALAGKANISTITNSENLNNITTPGVYYVMSGTSNAPVLFDSSPYGLLLVAKSASGNENVVQTFFAIRQGYEGIAQRGRISNTWRDWVRIGDAHTDSNLAYVENSTTASRAYSVGNYVIINGVLCKITAAVANGGTLTSGTNYTAVGSGGFANNLEGISETYKYHQYIPSSSTKQWYIHATASPQPFILIGYRAEFAVFEIRSGALAVNKLGNTINYTIPEGSTNTISVYTNSNYTRCDIYSMSPFTVNNTL